MIGWLKMNCIYQINFAVVQVKNAFYEKHDIFGHANVNGAAFLDETNHVWLRDDQLFIFSRNMKTDEMFGALNKMLTYIKSIHGVLHRALDIAVRIEYLERNPANACIKATPHNSAAALAVPFPPSTPCKNLDLHPVNLRFLQVQLTKNSRAIAPPHLCGIALSQRLWKNR